MGFLRAVGRLVVVVLVPLLIAAFIAILLLSIPEAQSLDRNEGERGRFTAERVDRAARPHARTVRGTFVSNDGAVKIKDVIIDADDLEVGDVVDAQYVPDAMAGSGVTTLDPHAARNTWLLVVYALATLGFWMWRFVWTPRLKASRAPGAAVKD